MKTLIKWCKCEFFVGIILGACIFFCFNLCENYWTQDNASNLHQRHYKRFKPINDVLKKFDLLLNPQQAEFIDVSQKIDASKLDNTTLAKRIKEEIKILCWVMAVNDIELDAAIYIKNSWGHRCNKFIIISSHTLNSIGTIAVLDEVANILEWNATKHSLWYLFEKELEYDWFYNADYSTFTIVENLRYFLSGYTPEMPIYFGHKFKHHVNNGFMYTRPGYVMSREALTRFGLAVHGKCRLTSRGYGCVELGHCMENVNVIAGDSRDDNNRDRFLRSKINTVMFQKNSSDRWMDEFEFYEVKKLTNVISISDTAIAFSNIPPYLSSTVEYVIYNLRAYGLIKKQYPASEKLSWKTILKRSETVLNE